MSNFSESYNALSTPTEFLETTGPGGDVYNIRNNLNYEGLITKFGASLNGSSSSAAFAKANAYFSNLPSGGTIVVPYGVWRVNSTIFLGKRVSLLLLPGAIIRATGPFTGSALVATSLTDLDDQGYSHDYNGSICGGGILDGFNIVPNGIELGYVNNFDIYEVRIFNNTSTGILAGVSSLLPSKKPFEIHIRDCVVARNFKQYSNRNDGTIGVQFLNVTDSYVRGGTILGYETGVDLNTSGGNNSATNNKIWVHPFNGQFLCGILASQRGSIVSENDIDTPFASLDYLPSAVNIANDTVEITGHPFVTGDRVHLRSPGTITEGLTNSTYFFIISVDANNIKFATSLANATANIAIDLTGTGTGLTRILHTKTPVYGVDVAGTDCIITLNKFYANNLYGGDAHISAINIQASALNGIIQQNYFKGENSTSRIGADITGTNNTIRTCVIQGNIYSNVAVSNWPGVVYVTSSGQKVRVYATSTSSNFEYFVNDNGIGSCIISFDLNPLPGQVAQFRYFRAVPSSSQASIAIFQADGTANMQHQIGGNINSFFGLQTSHRIGFGVQPNSAGAKLQVNGNISLATSSIVSATYSVVDLDSTLIFGSSSAQTITLQAPSTANRNRLLFIINPSSVDKTLNTYTDFGGSNSTVLPAKSSMILQSDGGFWRLLSYSSSATITSPTQVETNGASAITVAPNTTLLIVNPATVIANLTITLDGTLSESKTLIIQFGGTIASAQPVVTNLTITAPAGFTLAPGLTPVNAFGGDAIAYVRSSTVLYRSY